MRWGVLGWLRRCATLRLVAGVYQPTQQPDGWWRSELFGRSFHLIRGSDPTGKPEFDLEEQS
jgi:hypothetical protein